MVFADRTGQFVAVLAAARPFGPGQKHRSPEWVAWAWGLNGMASVVAPFVSVGISISLGISILFLAAVPVYLVAGFVEPHAPHS